METESALTVYTAIVSGYNIFFCISNAIQEWQSQIQTGVLWGYVTTYRLAVHAVLRLQQRDPQPHNRGPTPSHFYTADRNEFTPFAYFRVCDEIIFMYNYMTPFVAYYNCRRLTALWRYIKFVLLLLVVVVVLVLVLGASAN